VNCDAALAALSAAADHEPPSDPGERDRLAEHVATCARCADFARHVGALRAQLRFEPIDAVPDIASAVVAALTAGTGGEPHDRAGADDEPAPAHARHPGRRTERRRLAVAAAVAAVAGMAAGATFVGLGTEPQDPAAADVPGLVLSAQRDVDALDQRFELTEHGRPAGGAEERRFAGHLVYAAPESLALTLTEEGGSAGDPQSDGDVRLVAAEGRWWLDTPRRCASCPSGTMPWSRAVSGREPFSDASPLPLELVNPVESFTLSAEPGALGGRAVAGRAAVGVEVTAAQVGPLLDGLSPAGGLRSVHPSDPVELWLDRDHLVPLALTVRAGGGPARERWAAAHGYRDRPGAPVLELEATDVRVGDVEEVGVDPAAFAAPAGEATQALDDGFRDGPAGGDAVDVPTPSDLPDGFEPHRSGTAAAPGGPVVGVRSWTDGRAWLRVRATAAWDGPRLFGDLGPDVRIVDLGPAGRAYASADGRRVAIHGDGIDLVVGGSVDPATLRAVAASLGVTGRPVPEGWTDAASATLADAAAAAPGLLVADDLPGFGAPAVTVAGGAVIQAYAGPGDRGFVLTRDAAPRLAPPSGPDATGVELRGTTGRYSQERGELEWVEGGASHSLRSPTLTLPELLAVAADLEAR
jgi:hypothetical protein